MQHRFCVKHLLCYETPEKTKGSWKDMAKQVTGTQIRAARALLGWSQYELGNRTSLSQAPIARMESDISKSRDSTVMLVVKTLEEAGIEFVQEEDGTVGVKLKPGEKRGE